MNNIDLLKSNNVDVNAALELWGDIESYNESLKEFKDTLNSKLANLEKFKNDADWQNYAILAHSIKSELKYLGFMKDSEVFLNHELQGKASNGSYITSNYNDVLNTARKIILLLNSYFNETGETRKNILIADDSNIILNFLEKNISNDYKILKANDGNEAISCLN